MKTKPMLNIKDRISPGRKEHPNWVVQRVLSINADQLMWCFLMNFQL